MSLLSIGLVFSFIGGVIPLLIASKVGDLLSMVTGMPNALSTLILSIILGGLSIFLYARDLIQGKQPSHLKFVLVCFCFLVFMNGSIALFIKNWSTPNFRMESELNSITATFATSWIYVILGIWHDFKVYGHQAKGII
ncbi:MAG: hypothetical protein ABJG68_02630 [Crocinitomicaceae bacterium]